MKKSLLENALNKAIILNLKVSYKSYKGYLVKDEFNPKRYKILPLDIEQEIIVFPASYVRNYMFLLNGIVVK